MCLGNQSVELGAKFCMFEADKKVEAFLKDRARCTDYESVKADNDAVYAQTIHADAAALVPQVALPHNMSVVKPVSELGQVRIVGILTQSNRSSS